VSCIYISALYLYSSLTAENRPTLPQCGNEGAILYGLCVFVTVNISRCSSSLFAVLLILVLRLYWFEIYLVVSKMFFAILLHRNTNYSSIIVALYYEVYLRLDLINVLFIKSAFITIDMVQWFLYYLYFYCFIFCDFECNNPIPAVLNTVLTRL